MFARSLIVFAILLVAIQGEPATQHSQLSNILALREGRPLEDEAPAPPPNCFSRLSPQRAPITLAEVKAAISQCSNDAYNLIYNIDKIDREAYQFERDTFYTIRNKFNTAVQNEYSRNSVTIAEYTQKAKGQDVDIARCTNMWGDSRVFEAELIETTMYENLHKFIEQYRTVVYQYKHERSLTRYDLKKLDVEAWQCDHDDLCLRVVLRKVKVYQGYVNYDLSADISGSLAQAIASRGQVTTKLNNLSEEVPQKWLDITDEFVKCAKRILV